MASGGKGGNWARYVPTAVDGVHLMQAHFTGRAFERHSHDTWSIGLTHSGVQAFRCNGGLHGSHPGCMVLFNPDQAHDGQAGVPEGFGYSMLYVPTDVLHAPGDRDAGLQAPRYFREPVVRDAAGASLFVQAAAAIAQPQEALHSDALLQALLLHLLLRHGGRGAVAAAVHSPVPRLERVREIMEARYAEDLTVADIAAEAGLSRAHVTRAFTQAYGAPPHVYLNAVRLRHARAGLLAGRPAADVAVACGFSDQAHFTRRFRGAFGLPPGRWLRQVTSHG